MNRPEMRIELSGAEQGRKVAADIEMDGRQWHLYFRSLGDETLSLSAEALLAAALLPAMQSAGRMSVSGEISRQFQMNLEYIQAIFSAWNSEFRHVEISAPVRSDAPSASSQRAATFFSAGVDSFYTLFKRSAAISDLVFVHGFDIALSDTNQREIVAATIRHIAEKTGKHLIEVETNIREFLDDHVLWGLWGHGPAMACIAHLLSDSIGCFFIPASFSYTRLFPWGTHPMLDHLWGTETLTIIHDGCEANRIDKVALLSRHELAMRNLRVCFNNREGVINCGTCKKCVRTMLNLHVAGALEKCPAFDAELDMVHVQKLATQDPRMRHYYLRENLEALRKSGRDRPLQKALVKALNKDRLDRRIIRYWRDALRKIRRT